MSGGLRRIEAAVVGPIAARLAPYVSANVVSILSLLAALGAGAAFWLSRPATGALLILANGFLDMLDGCVARARGTTGPFGSFVDKIIDKYADLIFLLGLLLGDLAHPVPAIVSMVGIPLATYINAAAESLTKGEVKFQERLSLRFLRLIFLVLGGLSHRTQPAVWLVAATVVYAVASRMVMSLVFLRRRTRLPQPSGASDDLFVGRASSHDV
ncbi:MAG: CDP-alcohol phosphatidyltransferase family protein [Planctomycetes bacterium]|jgi:phosphatidylglycerophosphate synthase|nr:CDP-alcohol phosphatidyltransferase family protein [Planctomycetota bacterium]